MQKLYKDIGPFFKRILLFIIFCSIAYTFFVILWGTYLPKRFNKNLSYRISNSYRQFQEADTTKNIDILFLGSSHAYRGFDTRIFEQAGLKTFNLGTSAQTPLQTQVLLDRYLDQFNPKLIVYEVYPITFSIDGIEGTLFLIPNNPDLSTSGLLISQKHIKVLNTQLFSLKHKLFPKNVKVPRYKLETYVSGGFVERSMSYYKPEIFDSKIIEINDEQLHHFESCIANFKRSGIPYVLVQAPITKVRYNAIVNNEYFDGLMRGYGSYYNYNNLIELDDSLHFYDSHHLNQKGVAIFNKKFICDILEDSAIIP